MPQHHCSILINTYPPIHWPSALHSIIPHDILKDRLQALVKKVLLNWCENTGRSFSDFSISFNSSASNSRATGIFFSEGVNPLLQIDLSDAFAELRVNITHSLQAVDSFLKHRGTGDFQPPPYAIADHPSDLAYRDLDALELLDILEHLEPYLRSHHPSIRPTPPHISDHIQPQLLRAAYLLYALRLNTRQDADK